MPLFHAAAQHCFLIPGLYLGATNVILDGADPAVLLETVERETATKLFCPPIVWISLLQHPDFDTRRRAAEKCQRQDPQARPAHRVRAPGRVAAE